MKPAVLTTETGPAILAENRCLRFSHEDKSKPGVWQLSSFWTCALCSSTWRFGLKALGRKIKGYPEKIREHRIGNLRFFLARSLGVQLPASDLIRCYVIDKKQLVCSSDLLVFSLLLLVVSTFGETRHFGMLLMDGLSSRLVHFHPFVSMSSHDRSVISAVPWSSC